MRGDELFGPAERQTYPAVARVIARLRREGYREADEVEAVLLAGLPPREPGADDEAEPAIEDDGARLLTFDELDQKQETAHGQRRRSVADLLTGRASTRW